MKVNSESEPLNEHGEPDCYRGPPKPGYYECDMCARKAPYLININDGAWAICWWCMDYIYRGEEE